MISIPIAQPIIEEPIISTQESTIQICKTCKELFHRKEEDNMTSHYYRCNYCIDKQVTRGIIASCILQ